MASVDIIPLCKFTYGFLVIAKVMYSSPKGPNGGFGIRVSHLLNLIVTQ